jgi:hypothetical protein
LISGTCISYAGCLYAYKETKYPVANTHKNKTHPKNIQNKGKENACGQFLRH